MKKKRNSEGKRLQHFELSNKNWAVRWVLIAILLIIAGVALGSGLNSALQTPAGWHTVEGNSTALNCGEQFVLRYEYGAGENSPTAESKALELLYGKTIENAWKLFFNEAGSSELGGILKINQNPNKEIEIDSGLYQALEQVVNSGNRALYLAPVYAAYDQVFFSENDNAAKDVDPGQNEELKAYVQTLADYAKDSNAIGLVLLGESKVMLNVSQEYMTFSQENELRYFVDFGWLRNAFVADYIANELTNNGFTNGFIASVDGFTRNLDNRANAYSLNVFNKNQNSVELAAVMEYSAPKSLAFLRGYPMYDQENYRYYSFANGRIVTAMIDPEDGQSKVATDNLISYSENLGCGKLALSVMPVYVSDTFSEQALNELTNEGIYSVWFNDKQLMYNQQGLKLTVNDPYYTK